MAFQGLMRTVGVGGWEKGGSIKGNHFFPEENQKDGNHLFASSLTQHQAD
jgi:hypothetical protein